MRVAGQKQVVQYTQAARRRGVCAQQKQHAVARNRSAGIDLLRGGRNRDAVRKCIAQSRRQRPVENNAERTVAGIRLRIFFPATLIGILPVTFVFASIGSGIGDVLAAGQRPDLMIIFSPHILLPLIALAVLVMLPTLLRRRSAHA